MLRPARFCREKADNFRAAAFCAGGRKGLIQPGVAAWCPGVSLTSLVFMAVRALIFGFFGAALAYFVLREIMRFRAEWSKVFPIAMLANFVCAISETALFGYFDAKDPDFWLKYVGLTTVIGMVFAVVASWFGIKSESGRTLSPIASLIAGVCAVGPALGIGILVVSSFEAAS